MTDQEICINLKKLYDETESKIRTNAMVSRAFIDKISTNVINDKVNAQLNSIKTGIYNINPKFKDGAKNYEQTKKLVSETLVAYESALLELSEFYDGKIEQLILRKVELESELIGSILNEEYFRQKLIRNNQQKENDKVKLSVKDSIKAALERLKNKKTAQTSIDPLEISKLMDKQDVVCELDQKLSSKIEKTESDQKANVEYISKVEKEISLVNSEIERINERKQKSIYDAMEVGDKAMTTTLKRPRVIKRITTFFASRFNTAKVVENTIITPLNIRIENFKANELSSMKG
ncbi:MAG: hypothetical protein IKL55_03665 [Clostridia bacterium]|nr:hypothetical protein [Clostridia bacterium]